MVTSRWRFADLPVIALLAALYVVAAKLGLKLALVVSTTVSATFGVGSLALTGFAPWSDAGSIWLTWWLGDTAGNILVAPFLILWAAEPWPRWSAFKLLEAAALLVSLEVIGQLVFGPVLPRG